MHLIRSGRSPLAAVLALLTACPGDPAPVAPAAVARAIVVAAGDQQQGIGGLPLRDSVTFRVEDEQGRPLAGILVTLQPASGVLSSTSLVSRSDGSIHVAWTLGEDREEQTLAARAGSDVSVIARARARTEPPAVLAMLRMVPAHIAASESAVRELLPLNPQLGAQLQAKLAMLSLPRLALDVVHERRWVEGRASSLSGREVPIVAVFPLESMRDEATRSVRTLERGIGRLESFVNAPFPSAQMRLWEGFTLGNSGGGGTLFMEDQATYEARTPSTRLPYEAILLHEMAHSYVGNESLTQYLELLLYNLDRSASLDPTTWVFTRDWTPGRDANVGVHALLDVHRLIGPDAMARAYRTLVTLRPAYGQPLSPEARRAIVDEAPEALRAEVAAKIGTIAG